MKLLHISDLHIGKRVNGMSMLDDQCFVLAKIVRAVRERAVDAVLIAGDIYDKASPSAEAVTVLDGFLTALAELGVKVLAIPGNHDSAERIAYAQNLLACQGVCFSPVFAGEVECFTLHDEHGPVHVWLLPFLKPGDVRRFFPDEDIGDDYSAAIRSVLRTCDIDRSSRNVVVSHQLVTAKGQSPDRAEDEIKLGGIDNVDASLYDAFDYVALGHVHRPQRVGRDTVRYAGSPLKYSFSEARYNKSITLVELGLKREGDEVGACVSFEQVPLVPLHDMREVRTTLDALLAEGVAAEEGRDDYLHVTLTDEHPQLDAMSKVRELYPNVMALDYDNAAILAARDRVRTTVDPEKVDTVQLFAQFYEEQVGESLDEVQGSIVESAVRKIEEAHVRGSDDGKGA